jgi:hypothetical protein
VSCPNCGHQFKAVKSSTPLNAVDYVGMGIGFLAIAAFLYGASQGHKGGDIMFWSFIGFIVGLLVCAVGRIIARQ